MISLRKLGLSIRGKALLDNVTFDFRDGTVYGLLGPNGAGKTTLMKSMLGLTPHTGEVLSDGAAARQNEFGALIEYPSFYPRLTALENLEIHLRYLGGDPSDAAKALSEVGMSEASDIQVRRMSLGMRQRLGIARACLGSPRYLLLDEPTNGLDPMGIKEVRGLLAGKLRREDRCVIVSSHNLRELSAVSDELVFMRGGKVVSSSRCTRSVTELESLYESIFACRNAEGD